MSSGFIRDYVVKATGETAIWKHLTPQNGSGSANLDFTIPSGVNIFKVVVEDIETSSSTDDILIQLGDAGGLHVTGYDGGSHNFNNTVITAQNVSTAVVINRAVSTESFSGIIEFVRFAPGSHKWMWSGIVGSSASNDEVILSGFVTLDSELTTVSCQTSGSNTWQITSGFNILYENPDLAISGNHSIPAGVTDVFVNGVVQATTSGTEFDFEIPSGVKKVVVALKDVGTAGSPTYGVQIGDSGGIETTGYQYTRGFMGPTTQGVSQDTNSFGLGGWPSTYQLTGAFELNLINPATNEWTCKHVVSTDLSSLDYVLTGAGGKSLSGELTTVRLNATVALTGGSVNVIYENQELDLGSGVISGGVVQTVNYTDGEVASSSTTAPQDDTIMQNTEGYEFLSASMTPTAIGNKIKIEVTAMIYGASAAWLNFGIFQDSTADALSQGEHYAATATGANNVTLTHWMDVNTLDSTTFKFRAGAHTGNIGMNGNGATRRAGGAMGSSITITEYKA